MADRHELILELIPRLRRFARAVAGDAGLGDDVVKLAIVDALHQPVASKDKEAVFQRMLATVFHKVRQRVRPDVAQPVGANAAIDPSNVADRLMSLSLPERAALVLATTEALAYANIGEIIGTGEPAVRGYLTQAREKLCVGSFDHPEPIAEGEHPVRATSA